jgi:hypothetical protein
MKKEFAIFLISVFSFVYLSDLNSQATTQASMEGIVIDSDGFPLPGAYVIATHVPSGTEYGVVTRDDGRYNIPAMRIGGPYTIKISYIGFETKTYKDLQLRLGQSFELNIELSDGVELETIEILAFESRVLNEGKKGSSTNISKADIESMPTISRSIQDFTRLTPQSSGTSFGGQDEKAINFTVDGSILTNAFGLGGALPGASTNSSPISLDAIEEVQVNLAPYDVTQGGFVGAGINAKTRSGDNEFRGSIFYNQRNESFVGTNAKGSRVQTTDFNVQQFGFRLGGPIIKNKLFFFINGEFEDRMDPGTAFLAAAPGREGDNVTRVQKEDLENLRTLLTNRFDYDPGRFEDFSLPTSSIKFLAKIDYNINKQHNLSVRFNMMESKQGRENARTSFGFGGRNRNLFSMNFENSNYLLNDNFYSGIIELNSIYSNKYSNNLTVGYTAQKNFRSWGGGDFPAVDILKDGRNYISFGTDILSPNRALNSDIFQVQNNFTAYFKEHTLTMGANFEMFKFGYTFTPAFFGQYVFNSLDDFYRSVNGEEVELRRFMRNYSGLISGSVPTAFTDAYIASAYIQDEFYLGRRLKFTAGIRLDVPFYGNTAIRNPAVEELEFNRPNGTAFNINTSRLPDPQYMFNPRFGFNWDVSGDRSFQIRGGSGFFTGRPIYINISNMVNSNGLTIGQIREDNTTNFPFSPDINAHTPPGLDAPETYDLSYIEPGFRNPQVWRSNLALDKSLGGGFIATIEGLYTRQINDLLFYESNLIAPERNMAGPDNRPLYGFSDEENRINQNITNATVMANTDQGYSYSLTLQIQKEFKKNFKVMTAYNYGVAKNIADGNTQHFLSYENIHSIRGGNYPELGFSLDDQRHRFITSVSYRKDFGKKMWTGISLFYELANQGVFSYVLNGDANGDLVAGNDLMFVPTTEQLQQMNFEPLVLGGVTYSADEQRALFDNFINQDRYLSNRRGQYAERHGVQLPMVGRLDFSLTHNVLIGKGKNQNQLQFRVDVMNITNLLNNNWGVGTTFINDAPLTITSIDGDSRPTYQLNPVGRQLTQESFTRTANILDVWQMQFGIRYIFN